MNNSEEDMMNDPFETPLTETLQEPQEPPMPDQTYDTGDMNQVNESTESENLIPNEGFAPRPAFEDAMANDNTSFGVAAQQAQFLNNFLDRIAPLKIPRWVTTAVLLVLYLYRVISYGGFAIITYTLAIHTLSNLLLFLAPQHDPALDMMGDDGEDGPVLPDRIDDEFRPFVRKLPEFSFWKKITGMLAVCLVLVMFTFLDIPVYTPILLIYFGFLAFVTLRQRIQHMVKYHYVPFTRGKKRWS
eukprot:TRINITY_DN29780_c0_g1_i1.p1 TRINITY_DN29780_c0_g1~~TRINITY_DN29780_c0_g1_i1.p1  ORF type:complete len:244 (-),score=50.25 TRINITY_DN29780_c0_g1_i1:59-790(-)